MRKLSYAVTLGLAVSACAGQTPIDFSYAGYGGGGVAAPAVPSVVSVRSTGGDDTNSLQTAIDTVAARQPDATGFRGAVLLLPERYRVAGHLQIRVSGVVLRGVPNTVIVAAGTSRRTLIEVGATSDPITGPPVAVTEDAPAGTR